MKTTGQNDRETQRDGAIEKVWSACIALVQARPIVVLGFLFCGGVVGLVLHIHHLEQRLIESTSLENTQAYADVLREFRQLYTSEVVQAANTHGLEVTHDYQSKDGAIPLPATLTMMLGNRLGNNNTGVQTKLYSPYPFPWRRESGGLQDPFSIDAWAQLNKHPDQPYYKIESVDGRLSLRYASADRMGTSCVQCHNSHPESPKVDWKEGDVRGVLEVIYPVDASIAQSRANLRGTAILMLGMALLGLVGVTLAISGIRRTVMENKRVNERLAVVNSELESQKQELSKHNFQLIQANTTAEIANISLEKNNTELENANKAALNMMQDMEVARQEAEAAANSKSEFLANMSHEIRTPMTAIMGYSDLLLEAEENIVDRDPASSQRMESLTTIQKNGEFLLAIINDILDISKIESGQMTAECIECSPSQLAIDVVALLWHRANEKGLDLTVQSVGSIPETIQTDPTRLRQILVNLVGNAIKFTQSGGVRLETELIDAPDAENPRLRISVIDTGIGISPQQQSKLFQAFSQADTSTTRQFGGTGLGLLISKRLAQMLGGDITIESQLGQGARFDVTIQTGPLQGVEIIDSSVIGNTQKQRPADADPKPKKLQSLDCRILLAEDGLDNQRLISFILKKAGAEVTIVENGQLAYDHTMQAWQAGQPFDVILMDMQMPELDGYGATRQLREQRYNGIIIALTAHAMAGDREKCLDAGCNEYTTKPVNRTELISMIHAMMASSVATPTA